MKICSIPILMLIVLGLAVPASADGIIIINPPPDVNIKLGQALTIKYHHVNVTIKNQMATTRVDQAFLNENPWPAEGTYIFPLPKGAAVSNFVMWVDGKPVKGEILGAKEARAIYDDIVRRMRDPALLEYVGRGALKASVFPIPPGGERRIQLEYSQLLAAENGLIHYLYPLSTEKHSARPLKEMAISASVESPDPIKAVYSPSHDVFIEREDDRHALLGLEEFDVLPEKDFELYYTVSQEKVGLNLLSFKEKGEDGFLLLLAAPNVEVNKTKVVAKDVILVLDNSGSMKDDGKLDQAKKAALYVLENLNPKDRFNVLAFSTGLRTFQPELQPAYERDRGAEFVRRLEALGGTDINRALLEALKMADPERTTTLIFLTDGLATQGITDTGAILGNVQNASKRNVRVFSFGVGDDVDTDLLDQLSGDQRGMSTYVRPGQRIDEEVTSFYARISNPVLSEISLDFGNASVDQLYPEKLPDLFAGDQLVLVGRYREGGPANITLSGTVDGENESFLYPDGYLSKDGGDEFIPRLWATRAIGYYLTQIRLHGEKKEWVDTVVDLSIRYGIITPYTSFLIQEKDIFTQAGRQEIARRTQADMATERAYAPTGAKAVTKAAFQGAMSYAAAPPEAPAMMMVSNGTGEGQPVKVAEVVKQVGSKTFVLREKTWIDTAFDKEAMNTVKVTFLTQAYFDLISSVPDLAEYFALGEHVIAVQSGTAYEVVSG